VPHTHVTAKSTAVSQVSKATLKGYTPPAKLRRMALLPVLSKRFATRLASCVLWAAVGCGDANELNDDFVGPSFAGDASSPVSDASASGYDAGTTPRIDAGAVFPGSDAGTSPALDAGNVATVDSGSSSDASSTASDASSDAGRSISDAGAASDGGGLFPWPFPDLFPVAEAGAPNPNKPDGGRDVNGPCKDLNLLCFDFIDMWINAECQTCNAGKGCQGCSIPFAY
jgi:hypothetical protein